MRRASGPGSPTETVRVMSEQYPSTMQPKSRTSSSPGSIRRSDGRAWGLAPLGPAATMGSKLMAAAPRRRISNSRSSPNSSSVGREASRPATLAKAASAIAQAARMRATSPASFTRRSPSISPSVATSSAAGNHSVANPRCCDQVTPWASRPTRP